jgi:hypothetical protein
VQTTASLAARCSFRNNPGGFAKFTAIRRALSRIEWLGGHYSI